MFGMTEPLPTFRYHPNPMATGSVVPSPAVCLACGQARGYIYAGPVYAVDEITDGLCPWCIADGTAATKFDAEFTDAEAAGSMTIAAPIRDELLHRTPGYTSWQQDHWLYHCEDGCAFLGAVGRIELDAHPEALEMLRDRHQGGSYVETLSRDGSPTAYLFRCLRCGAYLAYSDAD
jgi:uncharacterized protein